MMLYHKWLQGSQMGWWEKTALSVARLSEKPTENHDASSFFSDGFLQKMQSDYLT